MTETNSPIDTWPWGMFNQTEGIEFVSGILGPQKVNVDGITFTIEYSADDLDSFDEEYAVWRRFEADNPLSYMAFMERQMLEHITAYEDPECKDGNGIHQLTRDVLRRLEWSFALRIFEALIYATQRQRLCYQAILATALRIDLDNAGIQEG